MAAPASAWGAPLLRSEARRLHRDLWELRLRGAAELQRLLLRCAAAQYRRLATLWELRRVWDCVKLLPWGELVRRAWRPGGAAHAALFSAAVMLKQVQGRPPNCRRLPRMMRHIVEQWGVWRHRCHYTGCLAPRHLANLR